MFKEHTRTHVDETEMANSPNFCQACGNVVDKSGLHDKCTVCGMNYDKLGE